MGQLGKLFEGQKINDEAGGNSDGKQHQPRFDIDLDGGVVRLGPRPSAAAEPAGQDTDQVEDGSTD
ncbi:hypothetical protein GCM10023321_15410 [Pseudonocardia eucalypti]|uniref:Uncharacterized protein n=1 Tax=Pseudonocardia eucalypti TaxID=648755 RepID=A0ABP9PQ77_9PSEU|nr:hypothetical protein [Pseudonocardia eucalypti]